MLNKQSLDLERSVPRLVGDWRFALFIVLAGIVQQAVGHLNGDDSWFLTFAEKYRDGLVPYIDISDPNPPAAFLAYLPAVLIGRGPVSPELVLSVLTFLGAGASIFLAGAILRRASLLGAAETFPALALAAYVLLFVPAFCFAEREHIALLAILPMIALGAARASGKTVPLTVSVLAGIGCGLACSFKPHYVFPPAFVFLYAALVRRRPGVLLGPETWAAGIVLLIYVCIVLTFFPAYVNVALPIIIDVYGPLRDTLPHILGSPLFLANIGLLVALAFASRFGEGEPRTLAATIGSAGFLLTFFIQGKGWNNHAYPGIALALLASASFLSGRRDLDTKPDECRRRRVFALFVFLPALCVAPFLFGTTTDFRNLEEYPGLTAAVRRVAPAHPRIIALAEQLDVGHPLVRHLHGVWAGRQNCLWISWGVRYLLARGVAPAEKVRLLDHMRKDEAAFAEDVDKGKPDILLVESPDVESWARTQPALQAIFQNYRKGGQSGEVGIWRRYQSGPPRGAGPQVSPPAASKSAQTLRSSAERVD